MISIHKDWEERLLMPPKNWQTDTFVNARAEGLAYGMSYPDGPSKGHVLYVEGLNESTYITYELAKDFNNQALAFSVFDRMGQSHGGRYLKDKFKTHSQGFAYDAEDLVDFVKAKIPEGHKVTLLGHSTGGLIALMAYHDHPELFTQPLINTPLLGMMNKHMRNHEEMFASRKLPPFVQKWYVYGGHAWGLRGTGNLKAQDDYSSHPERMKLHDYFAERIPSLRNGDPTYGWLWHACAAMMKVRDPRFLDELGPVTIMTAGKDVITDNERVYKAIRHLRNVTHIHMSTAKHETLFETDDIRNQVIAETVKLALNG